MTSFEDLGFSGKLEKKLIKNSLGANDIETLVSHGIVEVLKLMGKRPFDTKDLNEFLDVINEEKLFFPIIAELDTLHAEVTNSQKMLIFNEIYGDFDEEIIEYLGECRFDNLYGIAMMQAKEFAIEIISKKNNLKKGLGFCIQIIEQVESVLLKYGLSRGMSSEEIEKMKGYDF